VHAGAHAVAQQHMALSQSLSQHRHHAQLGLLSEGMVLSLGQTLQSLNATDLATHTFKSLAPTSGGHASVNKPPRNGTSTDHGVIDDQHAGFVHGTRNTNGLANSQAAGHNSNSSIANGSNGTSVHTSNAANSNLAVFARVPSVPLDGSYVPSSSAMTPEQLVTYVHCPYPLLALLCLNRLYLLSHAASLCLKRDDANAQHCSKHGM
jgi:hypothetical protein